MEAARGPRSASTAAPSLLALTRRGARAAVGTGAPYRPVGLVSQRLGEARAEVPPAAASGKGPDFLLSRRRVSFGSPGPEPAGRARSLPPPARPPRFLRMSTDGPQQGWGRVGGRGAPSPANSFRGNLESLPLAPETRTRPPGCWPGRPPPRLARHAAPPLRRFSGRGAGRCGRARGGGRGRAARSFPPASRLRKAARAEVGSANLPPAAGSATRAPAEGLRRRRRWLEGNEREHHAWERYRPGCGPDLFGPREAPALQEQGNPGLPPLPCYCEAKLPGGGRHSVFLILGTPPPLAACLLIE